MASQRGHIPVPAAPIAPLEHRPGRERARKIGARGALYSVATFFTLFAALPFAWMVFTVFKANTDLYNARNNPFNTTIRQR